jgi:hypothetical protein
VNIEIEVKDLISAEQLLPGEWGEFVIPHEEMMKYDQEDLEELQKALRREAAERNLALGIHYDIDRNQYVIAWAPTPGYVKKGL